MEIKYGDVCKEFSMDTGIQQVLGEGLLKEEMQFTGILVARKVKRDHTQVLGSLPAEGESVNQNQ